MIIDRDSELRMHAVQYAIDVANAAARLGVAPGKFNTASVVADAETILAFIKGDSEDAD